MYIRDLHIRNLKLLKDFRMSFCNDDGTPRMWTMIIGENGTGKTSILQAIAMAAAGARHVNSLADNVASLRDKRSPQARVSVVAEFDLDTVHRQSRPHPGLDNGAVRGPLRVRSTVELKRGERDLSARSRYDRADESGRDGHGDPDVDPLVEARSRDAKLWFIAAYGIYRFLPRLSDRSPTIDLFSIERLRSV
ncbi:MAG: AAA family ATPase, partial [Myxococcota bacterium]